MALMVDRLSPDELQALAAYDLGRALNEVLAEVARVSSLLRATRDRVATAKVRILVGPTDEVNDAKAERVLAETALQHLRDRISTLRLYGSMLQSLLRVASLA